MFLFLKINKKGVSPIIATVLLIAFAVALGAVVMNWGKGFVESTAQDTQTKANLDLACEQKMSFGVKKIGSTPKICYNSTSPEYVNVMLENTGSIDITGMQFVVFSDDDDSENIDNVTVTIASATVTKMIQLNHSLTGSIVQVDFIPKILPSGSTSSQLCSRNKLSVSDLSPCT